MSVRDYPFSIGANSSAKLRVFKGSLLVREASQPFELGFSNGDKMIVEQAFKYVSPEPFEELTFTEISGSPLSLIMAIGDGEMTDGRLSISGSITNKQVVPDQFARVAGATFLDGVGGGILAADSTRKIAFVHNEGPGVFWLSESTSHGASGIPVFPAMTLPIETTAGLVGRAAGGDVSYHITVTRFS